MERRITRTVEIGKIKIGSGFPVAIQSMTNTRTTDVQGTVRQIDKLVQAGCEIVRVAVPDKDSARGLTEIHRQSPVPLVADIHFDLNMALYAMDAGFEKLRINPGTMTSAKAVKTVVEAAVSAKVPIRIGVNSGSIHRAFRNLPRVEALVKSALQYCETLEEHGCRDIVVSLKSSSVTETYNANILFAQQNDYPLHLGVTEAGTLESSSIKSSVGIGALLLRGIGDTLRVSVTGPPEAEIPVAHGILRALDLRQGVEVISCPTCARSGYDVAEVAKAIEAHLAGVTVPLAVAVMGCVVNGPGEASHADLGIAFGPVHGVLFKRGRVVQNLPNHQLPEALKDLIDSEWKDKI